MQKFHKVYDLADISIGQGIMKSLKKWMAYIRFGIPTTSEILNHVRQIFNLKEQDSTKKSYRSRVERVKSYIKKEYWPWSDKR